MLELYLRIEYLSRFSIHGFELLLEQAPFALNSGVLVLFLGVDTLLACQMGAPVALEHWNPGNSFAENALEYI